jgi:hypothetical protein
MMPKVAFTLFAELEFTGELWKATEPISGVSGYGDTREISWENMTEHWQAMWDSCGEERQHELIRVYNGHEVPDAAPCQIVSFGSAGSLN